MTVAGPSSDPSSGAVADYARMKKKLFTITFLLGVVRDRRLVPRPARRVGDGRGPCSGVANIGIASSLVFYDAMLAHVARARARPTACRRPAYARRIPRRRPSRSPSPSSSFAFGHTLGFSPEPDGVIGGSGLTARLGFLFVAVWWLVFTIPYLRGRPRASRIRRNGRASRNEPRCSSRSGASARTLRRASAPTATRS